MLFNAASGLGAARPVTWGSGARDDEDGGDGDGDGVLSLCGHVVGDVIRFALRNCTYNIRLQVVFDREELGF